MTSNLPKHQQLQIYQRLLNAMNTSILVVDVKGQILFVNQAAEALLGVSASRAEHENVLLLLAPNTHEHQSLLDAFAEGNAFTKRQATIFTYQHRSVVVDYSVTPFEGGDISMSLIEISEMDRAMKISKEESILAAQDTTRQLVRGFAHEVKNPLGGIRGAAQLLGSELKDAELQEYTEVIQEEADRLRNLVDRMLGPNQPLKCRPLNIHQVTERIYRLVGAEKANQIQLQRDYDPSVPDVNGDFEQLIQAFLNIARNAMQALIENEVESPSIIFRTRVKRHYTIGAKLHDLVVRAQIIDNGLGIEPERIDEIFYPMISGRSEGTGLGLPIAQSIVSAHGGLIECQSRAGKTVFSIYLPIFSNRS